MSERPWTFKKCRCGHPDCIGYILSFSHAEGQVEYDDALLVCAAPDMQEALEEVRGTLEHGVKHNISWVQLPLSAVKPLLKALNKSKGLTT